MKTKFSSLYYPPPPPPLINVKLMPIWQMPNVHWNSTRALAPITDRTLISTPTRVFVLKLVLAYPEAFLVWRNQRRHPQSTFCSRHRIERQYGKLVNSTFYTPHVSWETKITCYWTCIRLLTLEIIFYLWTKLWIWVNTCVKLLRGLSSHHPK